MMMGVGYAYWLLPETRNVSLEAMGALFGSNDAQEDEARMQRIMADLYRDSGLGISTRHDEVEKVEVGHLEEAPLPSA